MVEVEYRADRLERALRWTGRYLMFLAVMGVAVLIVLLTWVAVLASCWILAAMIV